MRIETFTYFYPEAPRLMSIKSPLFEVFSKSPDWVAEKKHNGNRLEFHRHKEETQFWNRHEQLMDYTPSQELEEALEDNIPWPKGYCLLDGELRHNKVVEVKHKIVFYDVFIWDGVLLNSFTFEERRELLETFILHGDSPVSIPRQYRSDFGKVYNEVIEDPEIEGLVMKNLKGKLSLGRNSAVDSSWMWKVREESGRYRF